jgi:hypothetical protein
MIEVKQIITIQFQTREEAEAYVASMRPHQNVTCEIIPNKGEDDDTSEVS